MKNVAYNPMKRKVETVYPEDEVKSSEIIRMYWSNTLRRYVTIPKSGPRN